VNYNGELPPDTCSNEKCRAHFYTVVDRVIAKACGGQCESCAHRYAATMHAVFSNNRRPRLRASWMRATRSLAVSVAVWELRKADQSWGEHLATVYSNDVGPQKKVSQIQAALNYHERMLPVWQFTVAMTRSGELDE
jgi:hypothetical protein